MPIHDAHIEVECDTCGSIQQMQMEVGYDSYGDEEGHYSEPLTLDRMRGDGWEVSDDGEAVKCDYCVSEAD